MSATNATTNYSLPLFIGTDKPAWLVDWNGAMSAIDGQMKTNATDIQANATSISSLSTTVTAHTTSISTLSNDVTTLSTGLNTAQGAINTINSLIGNGTPTTTDQTIIGAINELHANQGDLANLTTTAKTSLVAAINEIAGGSGATVAAADVTYSNTTSGLTATNVQAAIDEVKNLIPSGGSTGYTLVDSVTADGTKTWSQLFDSLASHFASITKEEFLNMAVDFNDYICYPAHFASDAYSFSYVRLASSNVYTGTLTIKSSGSVVRDGTGTTVSDVSSTAPTAGKVISIYKI